MIKQEDMEKIASLPTQELIAFAIAQAQLNESLERENQCLKKNYGTQRSNQQKFD